MDGAAVAGPAHYRRDNIVPPMAIAVRAQYHPIGRAAPRAIAPLRNLLSERAASWHFSTS
jgi:hypothetical protein